MWFFSEEAPASLYVGYVLPSFSCFCNTQNAYVYTPTTATDNPLNRKEEKKTILNWIKLQQKNERNLIRLLLGNVLPLGVNSLAFIFYIL